MTCTVARRHDDHKIAEKVCALTSKLQGRRARLVAVLFSVALAYVPSRSILLEQSFTTETITFRTNVVPDTTNDEPIDVKATLYIPTQRSFPIPAVIIAPSSGGVEEERESYYAKELVKAGIAALVVDSFSPRNLTDSLYDQSQLDSWDIENDVIAALKVLTLDKRFKSDHIAIMGVSKGGTVAMDTSLVIRRTWMGVNDVGFAAHVAISPDCTWTTRSVSTTGAPILFLLAELDDQTLPQPCLAQAERILKTGNTRVETKVYKGAYHAWEELGAIAAYVPEVENYSKCRVWIEDDGQMFSADTGELLPEDQWHSWAKKNCMTLGAHCCGGTRELKETATQDIIAFLRKYGF